MDRKRRQRTTIFVIAGISLFVTVGAFGWLMIRFARSVRQQATAPTDPADLQLVFTAEALVRHGIGPVNPDDEQFSAYRHFDGSRMYNYTYSSPRTATKHFTISSMTQVFPSELGARQAFPMQRMTMKAGNAASSETRLVDAPSLLTAGDDRYAGTFEASQGPYGHVFIVRDGKSVVTVTLTGVVYEDAAGADTALQPVLDALRARFGS